MPAFACGGERASTARGAQAVVPIAEGRRHYPAATTGRSPDRRPRGPSVEVNKDGQPWRIGTMPDVAWLGDRPNGLSVETAVPLVFAAYATFYKPDNTSEFVHEVAV